MRWRDPSRPIGVSAHETTTAHLGALYPMIFATASSTPGVFIGHDLFGGAFCFDPFSRYEAGELTNPNAVVLGQIGRGKSSLLKTFLLRQLAFGRSAMILDPKGEYGALARQCGAQVITLDPAGTLRLNPLDIGAAEQFPAQLTLLDALGERSLERTLLARERAALEVALRGCQEGVPTIARVVDSLLNPTEHAAHAISTSVTSLKEEGRDLGLGLRRLVSGDLAGLFDEESNVDLDVAAPMVCLDLSALYGSPALGLLMACAASWLQAEVRRRSKVGRKTIFVLDEAWAVLREPAVARWLQASWKLSRAWGVANFAVLHRPSDLLAVGEEDTEVRHLAEGLLSDSETRICYQLPPGEVGSSAQLLGLNAPEIEVLAHLPRGVALWKVGGSSTLVRHLVGTQESALVDTDGLMFG